MTLNKLLAGMLVFGVAMGSVGLAEAKDKDKGKGAKDKPGKSIKIDQKPGKGAKAVPPGQIKRYTRGAKLPGDLSYVGIDDLSKWNLKAPGKGNRYIRVGDEVLEVTDDLSTVVDAVGIVGDLLK